VDANPVLYQLSGHRFAAMFEEYWEGSLLFISFQTVAELRLIARRRNWGTARIGQLSERLSRMVIVPANDAVTGQWVDVMLRQERAGSRVEVADAWVAATAFAYDCPVLTNDRHDFGRMIGLQLLPPA
jgi:predicted nucleic acid-binding protein